MTRLATRFCTSLSWSMVSCEKRGPSFAGLPIAPPVRSFMGFLRDHLSTVLACNGSWLSSRSAVSADSLGYILDMSELRPTGSHQLRQRIGALAIAAVGLLFIWRCLADLPFGTIDNPGPGATPLMLAALLVILALWSMVGGTSGLLGDSATDDGEATAAESGALRHDILVIAGTTAAAIAFSFLGYRLTILGLLLFFLGIVERKPILIVLPVSFGLSYGSHALFERVLKVSLPSGPWGL